MERKEAGEKRPSGVAIGKYLQIERRAIPYLTTNGLIHPSLSEWLMGWPTNWSDLKCLEMDGFHKWLKEFCL
jgi:hypothetical protein